MEDKKKIFVRSDWGDNYYTTNPVIIHTIKCRKCISSVLNWIVGFCILFCLTTFILICVNCEGNGGWVGYKSTYIPLAIFGSLSLTTIIISIIMASINSMFDIWSVFVETDEYQEQSKRYEKQRILESKKAQEKKARDLVESYDILDDKNASKEERIEKIKKYIK